MEYTIIALVAACIVLATWLFITARRVNKLTEIVGNTALDESEFRKELKREMSKLHDYCDGNAKAILLINRSLDAVKGDVVSINEAANESFCELDKKIDALSEKLEEFNELASESVRAQIESEKAWAEGVRAITSFGADIPALNLKGIEHG